MIIKFTQRDGYGSSIEFIERRGSDGADVDEKNNGFGPACRNSKRLVEYIGGFAAVQTFVSKTTYLTSAAIGMAESKVAGADGDITAAAFIIQFEAGVEIVVAGIRFIDGAGSPLPAQRADICGKSAAAPVAFKKVRRVISSDIKISPLIAGNHKIQKLMQTETPSGACGTPEGVSVWGIALV